MKDSNCLFQKKLPAVFQMEILCKYVVVAVVVVSRGLGVCAFLQVCTPSLLIALQVTPALPVRVLES